MKARSGATLKQFLDIPALEAWLKIKVEGIRTEKEGSLTNVKAGDSLIFEPIKGYGADKVTTDDLEQLAGVSKYSYSHELSVRVATVVTAYSFMMKAMNRTVSIWDAADQLMRIEPTLKVTVDRERIVSGYGPKQCPIQKVPLMLRSETVLTIVCTGSMPRINTPLFRVAEAILNSDLDRKLAERIVRTLAN